MFTTRELLESPFQVDWLAALPKNEQDEIERGVSERASDVLRAARFVHETHASHACEIEVKVWLSTGTYPTCVTVHWEARLQKFYVLVMDAACRERLATVVFERLPCVSAVEAADESARFFRNLARALKGREEMEMMDAIAALQKEYRERDE